MIKWISKDRDDDWKCLQMMEKIEGKLEQQPAYVRWPKALKEGVKHYYHGFRLLVLEIWLSSKYIWRFLRRKPLMRRERQQLVRTLSDVLRLIPFSAFIIIPFMEFTLPFFLRLFPNMLPSTFKDASKEVTIYFMILNGYNAFNIGKNSMCTLLSLNHLKFFK